MAPVLRHALPMVLAASAIAAGGAYAAVPAGNLVTNPGAEDAAGAPDGSVVPVPGWTTANGFTAVQYGAAGFPPAPPGAGSNFFAGGPQSSTSSASQLIDLSAARSTIDASLVDARLSALLAYTTGSPTVVVAFLDGTGKRLSRETLYSFDPAGFTAQGVRIAVPPGSRAARVTLRADGAPGNYNDALFDNVSLALIERRTPRPRRNRTVVVKPQKGLVVLERRGNRRPIVQPTVVPVGSMIDASRGSATIVSAADRFGLETERGRFSAGVFAVDQPVGADVRVSLGSRGSRVCSRPRHLVSRAPSSFTVLAGRSAIRARPRRVFRREVDGRAAWLTEDRCSETVIKRRAGDVEVTVLSSRSSRPRRVRRLWGSGRGRFRTRGRRSTATVRGRVTVRR
jgi:hypothetical protein